MTAAVSLALQGHDTIRKIGMNRDFLLSSATFQSFARDVIPTIPNLEVFDVGEMKMDDVSATALLEAIDRPTSKLKKVKFSWWESSQETIAAALIWEIRHRCERNRIHFAELLVTDVPTSLWPSILANLREASTVLEVLRQKNTVLVPNPRNRP
jgi:hypothetical protein